MRKIFVASALLCLVTSANIFAQGGNGSIVGTVEDSSGALIPGVTVTLLSTETGVSTTALTNESGQYSFVSLIPRKGYRITAELPGFQTASVKDISLGSNETLRYNIKLLVAAAGRDVEVSISAQTLLATSSSSVGEALPDYRVRDLPLVGTDVLNLLRIMPGVIGESFAGVDSSRVNTMRDGLSVSDGRYANGVFATTIINPDMVGEIRLILAPVDAEYGRGNGQVQITTRSGTNRYTGAVNWNIQNTALNSNTWNNNRNIDATTGQWSPTPLDWTNAHNITGTYSGPVIKNKTFFFAQYNQNLDYRRNLVTASVMTDTARQGIFRYFERWNNGNALANIPTFPASSTTGTYPVVDFAGNPRTPPVNPDNSPYSGGLRCLSVFGNTKVDGSPFTQADCPGGVALIGPAWDQNRTSLDKTGYIQKILTLMPKANYFGSGDGLNTAAYRYVRGRHGTDGGAGGTIVTGADQANDRKQFNLKIDQNFSANHRLSVSWSRERNHTVNNLPNWPGGLGFNVYRNPDVLTSNLTSTLSPTLVNEARFGIRYTKGVNDAPWETPSTRDKALEFTATAPDPNNPDKPYNVFLNMGTGNYQFGGSANGIMQTNGQYNGNVSPLYSISDTMSWTQGRHAFKFGGEVRLTSSKGYNNIPTIPYPIITGGSSTANASPIATITNFTAELPNFLGGAGNVTGNRANAANMLYFLNGSVNTAQMLYWIDDPTDVANGHWENSNTVPDGRKYRKQVENEFDFFVKDDWRISKSVTLNLGLRYEYYGAPYIDGGFTTAPVGLGAGLLGTGRGAASLFENWLQPGSVYLSGYGSSVPVGSALVCQKGVAPQAAGLPISTCDPNLMTQVEFIGPGTSNANKSVVKNDLNNFGPAIGFAWTPSFGGQGKTTIRGGYQLTYGGSGRNGIATDGVLGGALGALSTATTNANDFSGIYLDLTKVASLVPVRPTSPAVPGGVIKIFDRNADFTAYDPNFATPYTQNFTLSVTRSLHRNLTMDIRYVSTESRKQLGDVNVNTPSVFNNKELFDALEITRAGGDAPLFDQMFAGLDLHGTAGTGYGPVGTFVGGILQHGSAHLRRNTTFTSNLANGNYSAVADSINGLNAVQSGFTNLPGGQALLDGFTVRGRALRNGCDRLANGSTTVIVGGTAASPVTMPLRCFAENYIVSNPQLDDGNFNANLASSNYHSVQFQMTLRPIHGVSVQGTYTFAKTLSIPNDDYTDPLNRKLDYWSTGANHDFRTNGTFELPIGPNKLLLGNSSGWLARLVEHWQTSWIYNMRGGSPVSIGGATTLYDNGAPDVVGPWSYRKGEVLWNGANNASGTYFGNPSPFISVTDPQCYTRVGASDSMGFNLQPSCTNDALMDAKTGDVLLQNALPGKQGTLGRNTIYGPGSWSLDGNIAKTFRISESKQLQLRVDSTNILNHPNLPNVTLNINNSVFGQIPGGGGGKTGTRTFQGQVRLTF